MNMSAVVAPSRNQLAAIRRVLIAVLAIAALLVGLFAMHMLHASTSVAGAETALSHVHSHADAGSRSAETATDSTSARAVGATTVTQGCDGMCEISCLLVGMICALSILAAIVGLLIIKRPSLAHSLTTELKRVLRVVAQSITAPAAPSLEVLSISRT